MPAMFTDGRLRLKAASSQAYRLMRIYSRDHSQPVRRALADHLSRRLRGESCPTYAALALTYRCQCNCVHCYADADMRERRNELSTGEWKSVIDECRNMGTLHLLLTGGDPMLREDLCELVAHARRRGLLTRLTTCGQALTRRRVAELDRAGLTQAAVSVDSPDPAEHDRLRNLPRAFERAVEGIRNLRSFGIPCQILTYARRENITDGLKGIIALARRLGCMSVFILYPVASGHWLEAPEEALSEEEQARVRALQTWQLVHSEMPARGSMCCSCGKDLFGVSAQGEVAACPPVPFTMGNVRQRPLSQIWACHAQEFRLRCRGVCPMNTDWGRRALRVHAEKVRRHLGVETAGPR